jgi:signal peptidase II
VTSALKSPSVVILFAVSLFIVVFDQITKLIAIDEIGPEAGRPTVSVVPGLLELRYVENTGAAFGIFQDSTTALIFVSIGVVTLLAVVFWKLILYSRFLAFAFGLQFGGAIGNLIDRIRLGYVVDFVDVPLIPVFNVADSGITVGVAILAVVLLFVPDWSDPDGSRKQHENADGSSSISGESRSVDEVSQESRP